MSKSKQKNIVKKPEMLEEKLQNVNVRVEILRYFRKEVEVIFENTWSNIFTYIDDLNEKYSLSTEEMVLMCMILGEVEDKRIQTLGNAAVCTTK